MREMTENRIRCLIAASEAFLVDELERDDILLMDDQELFNKLEFIAWGPVDHFLGNEIWDAIEAHADTIQRLLEEDHD